MQVSQSASASSSIQGVNQQSQVGNQQANNRVDQEKQQNAQHQARFDIDQHAVALVEQDRDKTQQETQKFKSNQTGYDQPSSQNQTAVAAYQSIGNISQRESIKDVFGVDLFV